MFVIREGAEGRRTGDSTLPLHQQYKLMNRGNSAHYGGMVRPSRHRVGHERVGIRGSV